MNYNEAMLYISNTTKNGSNTGLDRTNKILEILGNPQNKIKCVHIAGTNGKGSTCAMITKILRIAGYKVGMYTSPYIEDFEERIQINGENIRKDDLCEVVTQVSYAVEKVLELGLGHPTEFEIITCAMFLYFFKQKVDIAVIEVGLGGRLDSTNVLKPCNSLGNIGGVILSIITSISYDHMQILGNTICEIAAQKAGIIKSEVPVVLYPQMAQVEDVIQMKCNETRSRLILVKQNAVKFISINNNFKQNIIVKSDEYSYNIELSLLGEHQILNCAVAVYSCEELRKCGFKINNSDIIEALKNVEWIGRLEVLNKKPLIVLDGAHNIDGINNLVKSVKKYLLYNNMILIIGILADKKVDEMVSQIVPMAKKIIVVTPNSKRAQNANELKNTIKKYNTNCEAVNNYEEAYDSASTYCKMDDLILVCGSLYMIGDMRKIIKSKLNE
jgi:dihydrofolate synthase / folylpolyglutamate synthase